ncbi:MAG: glycoside hydrolase family 3 C-terminal domain-containing protein [Bacteroidales bacterium]|nr:glycoside hydrolase family 3 C-terminal domain-containing protein [Bacteroidales bacterium]
MRLSKFFVAAAAVLAAAVSCGRAGRTAIVRDAEIERKVEATLSGMTLDDKIGQMVQLAITNILDESLAKIDTNKLNTVIGTYRVGSILNVARNKANPAAATADLVREMQRVSMRELGIPCLYGLDMIHGASYLDEGTLFPQEIGMAATFNLEAVRAMGTAIGYESRAALVPWVFSPVMDLGRNACWSRHWESWGEDPYLSGEMSRVLVLADQGEDPNHIDKEHVATSIKHYMAYGVPLSGKDRTPAYVPYNELRERYFHPFKESIEAGALSLMVNSASINGLPVHANRELLTGWLKEDLGWDGMIITDWADVNNLYKRERVAEDKVNALALAVNAGIDMIMDPYDVACCADLKKAVEDGLVPMSRIDDAVRRILRLKYRLNLFDEPTWDTSGYELYREDFIAAAKQAAIESEVLLKNEDGILPLAQGTRILVTGPCGNSMRTLGGGWNYTWQGSKVDEFTESYNTIFEALAAKFGAANVRYVPGVAFNEAGKWYEELSPEIPAAVAAARQADVIVACVGENSYCESPGNLDDLTLSENQRNLVKALYQTGKPIVLILNEGRPRVVSDIEPLAKAVVDVMLPGNFGGDALAELLSGDANFSGKLPFTYPRAVNDLHTYDYKVSELVKTMGGMYDYDAKMEVQWRFGDGLSYTTFAYSDMSVDKTEFVSGDILTVSVKVINTGSVAGKESVLLFSSDLVASLVPDNRRLRAFDKIDLAPGESKVVELKLPADDLAFVGYDGLWRLEEGDFRLAAGSEHVMVRCARTKVWETPNK